MRPRLSDVREGMVEMKQLRSFIQSATVISEHDFSLFYLTNAANRGCVLYKPTLILSSKHISLYLLYNAEACIKLA